MIMKKLSIFLISLFLASCDQAPKTSSDGYEFGEKEYEKTQLQIEFVILKNDAEFNAAAKQYVGDTEGLQAFSRLLPSQNKCIVYIKDPNWKYEPEYIGHEVSHCIWGRWHPNKPHRG
jgi:hypothetical protein